MARFLADVSEGRMARALYYALTAKEMVDPATKQHKGHEWLASQYPELRRGG